MSLIRLGYFKSQCNFTADLELWVSIIKLGILPWRFTLYEASASGHKVSFLFWITIVPLQKSTFNVIFVELVQLTHSYSRVQNLLQQYMLSFGIEWCTSRKPMEEKRRTSQCTSKNAVSIAAMCKFKTGPCKSILKFYMSGLVIDLKVRTFCTLKDPHDFHTQLWILLSW